MSTKKLIAIVSAGVGVLLVAVVVLLVVVINQNSRAADQDEHERRVAICEQTYGDMATHLDEVTACINDLESR